MAGGLNTRKFVVALVAVSAMPLLSGCDGYYQNEVTNGCVASIEVANAEATGDKVWTEVAPGERADVEGSSGPFDVVVRAPGGSGDGTTIAWDDMSPIGEQSGRKVTVEGETCPGQQS